MKSKVEEAKESGFIALEDLAYVLGCDEVYNTVLPELYESYQCHVRNPNPPNTILMWVLLLNRLSCGGHDAVAMLNLESLKPIQHGYLRHYRYDFSRGVFEEKKPDYFFSTNEAVTSYFSLVDLKEYFTTKLEIPLPKALYGASVKNAKENTIRRDTEIREKCREYAKQNWVEGMTVKDMYNLPGIKQIAGDKLPSLKTFSDRWMKGLNPKSKNMTFRQEGP